MIYATDLDRTIIFSSKFIDDCKKPYVCVERDGDRAISYMCKDALQLFNRLKRNKKIKIVPITTRSVAQFNRVEVVQDCEYAITSNGGIIFHKGIVFKPWQEIIEEILTKYKSQYSGILQFLQEYLEYFDKNPRVVDDIFFFMKLKDDEIKISEFLDILEEHFKATNWVYTLQGLKLYIIPKEISKENALRFLMSYLQDNDVIVSGDGKLDYNFLKVGNKRIIPKDSEVLGYIQDKDFTYESVPSGLKGTYDLFSLIENSL